MIFCLWYSLTFNFYQNPYFFFWNYVLQPNTQPVNQKSTCFTQHPESFSQSPLHLLQVSLKYIYIKAGGKWCWNHLDLIVCGTIMFKFYQGLVQEATWMAGEQDSVAPVFRLRLRQVVFVFAQRQVVVLLNWASQSLPAEFTGLQWKQGNTSHGELFLVSVC